MSGPTQDGTSWHIIELRKSPGKTGHYDIDGYIAVKAKGLTNAVRKIISNHLKEISNRNEIDEFQPTVESEDELPAEGPVYVKRRLKDTVCTGAYFIITLQNYSRLRMTDQMGAFETVSIPTTQEKLLNAVSDFDDWSEEEYTLPSERADTEGYASITDF